MGAEIPVPAAVLPLCAACADAGGRALLVGGYVRDALNGAPVKDVDVEVHGLPLDALVATLRPLGRVNEVGRSFGVLKLKLNRRIAGEPDEIDVSLPRRDSRQGPGHRGIQATADPFLGIVEAARRRDLTINAIAYDPLLGAWEDPFHGREDLERRILRAVDAATFGEDPLRALRVAQFAGRFEFAVDPALEALCRAMPLHELPAERIRGEVEKLLLRSRRPSLGWNYAWRIGAWAKVLPEWGEAPEALDRAAAAPIDGEARRLALLLAAGCSGGDLASAERALDRLRMHRVGGYRVREQVLFLVAATPEIPAAPVDETTTRRWAERGEVALLAALAGRPDIQAAAEAAGVAEGPLPVLAGGADLTRMGVPAGPRMGALLAGLREAQLEGTLTSRAAALDWLRARVEDPRDP